MASTSHVNGQSHGSVYPDESEQYGYASMFQNAVPNGQTFGNQKWALDPSLTSTGTPETTPFAGAQGWHHNPNTQLQNHHRQPVSATGQSFNNASNAPYGASFDAASSAFRPNNLVFNANPNQYQPYSTSTLDSSLPTAGASRGDNFRHDRQYYSSNAHSTIAPAALQNVVSDSKPVPSPNDGNVRSIPPGFVYAGAQTRAPSTFTVSLPQGVKDGAFIIVDQSDLAKATRSIKLSDFCNIGIDLQEFSTTKISNTPTYVPRRSRNDFKTTAAKDPKLLDKLSKKQAKVFKTKTPKISRPRLVLARTDSQSQASTPSSAEDSSSSAESDNSDSDDELDIVETPPIPNTRPSEPLEATKYDTIKAVWLRSKVHPSSDQIRKGLKDVWEVLSTLRDRWKSDGDALKTATEKKKVKELPMLKERVKSQRDMLDVALSAALEHGHQEILSRMGEIKPFLQMSNIFLVDRARETDFDSSLSKHLLQLLARNTTVTTDLLEQYKLKKTLSIFVKRGDEATKSIAKRIEEKAAAASKAQAEKSKESLGSATDTKETDSKPKNDAAAPVLSAAPSSVVGVKRPRPKDSGPVQPAKRTASGGSPSANSPKAVNAVTKRPLSAGGEKNAMPATKLKTAVPAKTTSLFAGLQSASKKPGTSNASLAALKKAASAAGEKKPATATAPPQAVTTAKSSSTFNFGEYMADLNKPKEPEPSKSAKKDDKPPETEEQKAKRLRKESRRHLRVSFKEGSALLEIRLFHHHPEEETGHDANMVRDVGNVGLEGRMFKQHKDQMDLDDDDEEDEILAEHPPPSTIDFSGLPEEAQVGDSCNFAKFGGARLPDSPEKAIREAHESNTLIVYYSHRSDIPPCPKEPDDPYTGDTSITSLDFGVPTEEVMNRSAALQPQSANVNGGPAGTPDVSALLKAINAMNHPPQTQPAQQSAAVPNPLAALQALMPNQNSVPNPQFNLAPQAPQPNALQANPDLALVLASLSAHTTSNAAPTPPPAQVPTPQMPPMPAPFPTLAPGQTPDLQQMMAMFAQFPGMIPPPLPGMAPPMQMQNSSDGNANNAFENPERLKRMREPEDDGSEQPSSQKWGAPKKKVWLGERPKFVKPCVFWQQGRCLKGADCTFLHEN